MKKEFKFMALIAFIFGSLAFYYQSSQSPSDTFIQENVEALGNSESMGTIADSRCPGPENYSIVGTMKVVKIVRTHKKDSVDFCETYKVKKCYADGIGSLAGNNVNVLDCQLLNASDEDCRGPVYHGTFWY